MNKKIKKITTVAIASTLLVSQAVGTVNAIENDKTNETVNSEITSEQIIEQAKKEADLATKNKVEAGNKLDKANSELNEASSAKDKAIETLNKAELDVRDNQDLYDYITDEDAKAAAEDNVTLSNDRVSNAKDELDKINDEVKVAQENVDNIKIELDKATNANNTAQSEKNNAEADMNNKSEIESNAKDVLDSAQIDKDKAQTDLNNKTEILNDLTSKKEVSDKNLSDKNEELKNARVDKDNSQSELNDASSDLTNKTNAKDEAQGNYDSINDKYEQANRDKENAEIELENATVEKDAATKALNEAQNIYDIATDPAKKEELQNQIIQAGKDLEQAQQDINAGENNVQAAKNEITIATNELENAKKDVTSAQKDMDTLKKGLSTLEETLNTKEKALKVKEQATTEAKNDFDFKQECVNKAQQEIEAANRVIEQSKQTILDSQKKIDSYTPELFKQLQDKITEANNIIKEGSIGFFKHTKDKLALDYINNNNNWSTKMDSTHIGEETDATTLENMNKSMGILREANRLRVLEGKKPLTVKGYMMAIAQINCNASADKYGHTLEGNVGENLAANSPTNEIVNGIKDAFEGWYHQEKKVYEYCIEHAAELGLNEVTSSSVKKLPDDVKMKISQETGCWNIQIGHYLNIVNDDYDYAGAAYSGHSENNDERSGTYIQEFDIEVPKGSFSGEDSDARREAPEYTVDEYHNCSMTTTMKLKLT